MIVQPSVCAEAHTYTHTHTKLQVLGLVVVQPFGRHGSLVRALGVTAYGSFMYQAYIPNTACHSTCSSKRLWANLKNMLHTNTIRNNDGNGRNSCSNGGQKNTGSGAVIPRGLLFDNPF